MLELTHGLVGLFSGEWGARGGERPARSPWPHLPPSVPPPLTPAGLGVPVRVQLFLVGFGSWAALNPCHPGCSLPSPAWEGSRGPWAATRPAIPRGRAPARGNRAPGTVSGIPAEGWKACGGAGLATARSPSGLASGGTADQTAPVCTVPAWAPAEPGPSPGEISMEGPPGGLANSVLASRVCRAGGRLGESPS